MILFTRSLFRSLSYTSSILGSDPQPPSVDLPVISNPETPEIKPKRTPKPKKPKVVDLNEIINIFTDGAARNNPGKAGIGFVFYDGNGNVCLSGYQYIGFQTNNYAEYQALIVALQTAIEKEHKHIAVFSDSQLIVRQMTGIYKVKHPNIIPLYYKATDLIKQFSTFSINCVPREANSKADSLANRAIDMMMESLNIK